MLDSLTSPGATTRPAGHMCGPAVHKLSLENIQYSIIFLDKQGNTVVQVVESSLIKTLRNGGLVSL
jgi:hypothetical protein